MKGLVIAGVHSGCGKTTAALGIMAALRRRGLAVAPFKVGPDFIDPGHHEAMAGRPSRNLDGWMLSRQANEDIFNQGAQGADAAVVEGVMGLFDGYDGKSEAGSTAQMAKWLGLPVLLVADARSMARSAAALVLGFENFDPGLSFCGVLFNRVGSPGHLNYLKEALESSGAMPCLGGVERRGAAVLPERHLGLVLRRELPQDEALADELAGLVEQSLDLDRLLDSLPELDPGAPAAGPVPAPAGARVRVAVARDDAFCFYYPENLEMLEALGAELVFFSPLNGDGLPRGIGGLILGGGYPELHAEALSKNTALMEQLRRACGEGMPIYAECGGFMTLCKSLTGLEGKTWPMAGCFDFDCVMSDRRQALGYREIVLARDSVIGPQGMTARGHEFHYSYITGAEGPSAYRAPDRTGSARDAAAYTIRRCLGSYVHLHFKSQPRAPESFVKACAAYASERRVGHAAS